MYRDRLDSNTISKNLSLQIQDIKKGKDKREEVWCIKCKEEGHHKDQCPSFQEYIATWAPNPCNHGVGPWCEICRTRGHRLEECYLLHKYINTPKSLYCNFLKYVSHDESNFQANDLLSKRIVDAYRMEGGEQCTVQWLERRL